MPEEFLSVTNTCAAFTQTQTALRARSLAKRDRLERQLTVSAAPYFTAGEIDTSAPSHLSSESAVSSIRCSRCNFQLMCFLWLDRRSLRVEKYVDDSPLFVQTENLTCPPREEEEGS